MPVSTPDRNHPRVTAPPAVSLTNPPSRLRINSASFFCTCAQVAELADALASGASGLTVVEVRVLSWAPLFNAFKLNNLCSPRSLLSMCLSALTRTRR